MKNRIRFLTHSKIDVLFNKNSSNFVVNELPLYEFSGDGEHLILHIRKKDLTTWDMLHILSEYSGAKIKEFGYAGLKDKEGMTTQYVSVHKNYEKRFENFSHPKIKILDTTYHKNKIKTGHLRGNRFFIRLKRVSKADGIKLENALKKLAKEGFPNYFGYQRFGINGENYLIGKDILLGKKRERNKRKRNFFISAYQSYLFNNWLSYRVGLSNDIKNFSLDDLRKMSDLDINLIKDLKSQKQFFKILKGDLLHHYPQGRAFLCEDSAKEARRFLERDITVTGWLFGRKSMRPSDFALEIEKKIFNEAYEVIDKIDGSRRFAWSFLEDVESSYDEDKKWFEMHFSLQKGSYATEILEELLK